jgi:hypothetical protein
MPRPTYHHHLSPSETQWLLHFHATYCGPNCICGIEKVAGYRPGTRRAHAVTDEGKRVEESMRADREEGERRRREQQMRRGPGDYFSIRPRGER